MLKAVFFDWGNTLLDISTFIKLHAADVNLKLFKKRGRRFSKSGLHEARQKAHEYIERRFRGNPIRHNAGLCNFYMMQFLGMKPTAEYAEAYAEEFMREYRKNKTLMPHARPLLEFLRREKVKLALVSNGLVKEVRGELKSNRMAKYFDLIIISEAVGKEKSTLIPFRHALKKLRLKPSEVVVVGDRLDEDIAAGRRLGMTTIRIKFGFWKERGTDDYEEADYVVDNLKELKALLTKLIK